MRISTFRSKVDRVISLFFDSAQVEPVLFKKRITAQHEFEALRIQLSKNAGIFFGESFKFCEISRLLLYLLYFIYFLLYLYFIFLNSYNYFK